MSRTIIVGKSENSFFFKIVKNLTLQKKYKVLLTISASSFQEFFQKILASGEEIRELKLKTKTQIHFGFERNPETKKLERCENLSQSQIISLKEIVSNLLVEESEITILNSTALTVS